MILDLVWAVLQALLSPRTRKGILILISEIPHGMHQLCDENNVGKANMFNTSNNRLSRYSSF